MTTNSCIHRSRSTTKVVLSCYSRPCAIFISAVCLQVTREVIANRIIVTSLVIIALHCSSSLATYHHIPKIIIILLTGENKLALHR